MATDNSKTQPHDWHPADILARLKKAGWTMAGLGKFHGYSSRSTLHGAIAKHWPKGEKIIAEAIGVTPAEIWPSRYSIANKHKTQVRKLEVRKYTRKKQPAQAGMPSDTRAAA